MIMSVERLTEGANSLRKCADILDECKEIITNEELSEEEREEKMEFAMARLVVSAMKIQTVFEQV